MANTLPKIHWSSPLELLAYKYGITNSNSLRIFRKTFKNICPQIIAILINYLS